jgi:hypothetical protein
MHYRILFLVLVFQGFFAQSQEKLWYWNLTGAEAMVVATNCYVRSEPSRTAPLLDSLHLGEKVKVIEETDQLLTLKGMTVPFVKIEYINRHGKTQSGYLWEGFLALGYLEKKELTYLTALNHSHKEAPDSSNSITVTLMVLKRGKLFSKTDFPIDQDESTFFEHRVMSNMGLQGLDAIYVVSFSGEACGIPTLFYYFGRQEKQWFPLPSMMCVGDADVYSHTEAFIFPKEKGGKPDIIFKTIVEESLNEQETLYEVKKWRETYSWEGKKAKFISKTRAKIQYKKANGY